jgi:hypothetical protein
MTLIRVFVAQGVTTTGKDATSVLMLAGATRRASGKASGGGVHPSSGAAWRRWRMLQAATFNGGEAALVTDDIDGVALLCWGRREKVRGESIWT